MSTKRTPEIDILRRKIDIRQKFLNSIIDPIEHLLHKKGVILKREIHSSHVHQVMELKDFGGFSFRSDDGQTMFGGCSIDVWYKRGDADNLVLALSYQTSFEECTVIHFDPKSDWKRALGKVIRNQNKIQADIEKRRLAQQKKQSDSVRQEARNNSIQIHAERLGLK